MSCTHLSEAMEHKQIANARDSRIELLRVIAMFFIVLFHVALSIKWYHNPSMEEWLFINAIGDWGILGVNTFVIISCYFELTKQTSDNIDIYRTLSRKIKLILVPTFSYIIYYSYSLLEYA